MKKLTPEQLDDMAIYTRLVSNRALAHHEVLRRGSRAVENLYLRYVAVSGNASHSNAPKARNSKKGKIGSAITYYYGHPPAELQFIEKIRKKGSPRICPMCGSLGTGTVDHVFPQSNFPEFAIYSLNLVPACDCNSKRGNDYRGANSGERVLHPYFDNCLRDRLIHATLTFAGDNISKPNIHVFVSIDQNDPNYAAANFHLNNVILRNGIVDYLEAEWLAILRCCETYFYLPIGPFSLLRLREIIRIEKRRYDHNMGSPNNWRSVLLHAIIWNATGLQALKSLIESTRQGNVNPFSGT